MKQIKKIEIALSSEKKKEFGGITPSSFFGVQIEDLVVKKTMRFLQDLKRKKSTGLNDNTRANNEAISHEEVVPLGGGKIQRIGYNEKRRNTKTDRRICQSDISLGR